MVSSGQPSSPLNDPFCLQIKHVNQPATRIVSTELCMICVGTRTPAASACCRWSREDSGGCRREREGNQYTVKAGRNWPNTQNARNITDAQRLIQHSHPRWLDAERKAQYGQQIPIHESTGALTRTRQPWTKERHTHWKPWNRQWKESRCCRLQAMITCW